MVVGELVVRRAESVVREALADTRVVLVNGARQSGKSALTRVAAGGSAEAVIRLLDDPATLQAAHADPTSFVDHSGLMVIDEIQLAPELLSPIKVVVDLDQRPGRFLLTGSSRILALRTLPDALPGRMEIIELWPFSQGEILGVDDGFIDAAFAHGPVFSIRRICAVATTSNESLSAAFPKPCDAHPAAIRRSSTRI